MWYNIAKIALKNSENMLTAIDWYGIILVATDREGHQEHDHAHDL